MLIRQIFSERLFDEFLQIFQFARAAMTDGCLVAR